MPLPEGYQALTENTASSFEQDIVQLETSTPALGGPNGIMNEQAKVLGGRTRYLLALLQSLNTDTYTRAQTDSEINDAVALLRAGVAVEGDNLAKLYALILQRQTAAQVSDAVQNEINNVVGAAPATLDTLSEIAAFAQDNESEIAGLSASIAARLTQAQGDARYYTRAIVDSLIENFIAQADLNTFSVGGAGQPKLQPAALWQTSAGTSYCRPIGLAVFSAEDLAGGQYDYLFTLRFLTGGSVTLRFLQEANTDIQILRNGTSIFEQLSGGGINTLTISNILPSDVFEFRGHSDLGRPNQFRINDLELGVTPGLLPLALAYR